MNENPQETNEPKLQQNQQISSKYLDTDIFVIVICNL